MRRLGETSRRIGELSMGNELLRAKIDCLEGRAAVLFARRDRGDERHGLAEQQPTLWPAARLPHLASAPPDILRPPRMSRGTTATRPGAAGRRRQPARRHLGRSRHLGVPRRGPRSGPACAMASTSRSQPGAAADATITCCRRIGARRGQPTTTTARSSPRHRICSGVPMPPWCRP
jgi:hypothetical protein